MTSNQCRVLRLLENGWKLRLRRDVWRLKQPDFVASFEDCPGGKATVDQLIEAGYLDVRNNLTEAGLAALALAAQEDTPEAWGFRRS